MTEYNIYGKDTNEISALLKELKRYGFEVHRDFDFEFGVGGYDWETHEHIPKKTKFIIYNDKLSTWMALKWM
jgi:hypothetical protein